MTTAVLNTKIREIENKIPDTRGLVTTTVTNAKIDEVENKISDIEKHILLLLFLINLQKKHLMKRWEKKNQLINLIFLIF